MAGEACSIHVKNNDGEIVDFVPLEDFYIFEDIDSVLNYKEAVVRCISKQFENTLLDIKYGKEYKAIGITRKHFNELEYLVMDESQDCYFYPHNYFEIIEDTNGVLDLRTGVYVYDSSIFMD